MLSRLSVAELAAELQRRRGMLDHLRKERDSLAHELATVESQIAETEQLGDGGGRAPIRRGPGRPPGRRRGPGRPPGGRRGRGSNKQSLQALLHSLLQGKTMTVAEMAEAAKQAGYKSTSKNFRVVVSLALLKHRNLFKRVARGQYTAK